MTCPSELKANRPGNHTWMKVSKNDHQCRYCLSLSLTSIISSFRIPRSLKKSTPRPWTGRVHLWSISSLEMEENPRHQPSSITTSTGFRTISPLPSTRSPSPPNRLLSNTGNLTWVPVDCSSLICLSWFRMIDPKPMSWVPGCPRPRKSGLLGWACASAVSCIWGR